MRTLKWLLTAVYCVNLSIGSIEKCRRLDSVIQSENRLEITMNSTMLEKEIKVFVNERQRSLLDKVHINQDGINGDYDGFFCQDSEGRSETQNCKKYLMHSSHQMEKFPQSILCFKKLSPEGKSTFVVILNLVSEQVSPFHRLHKKNSFKFAMRFLEALVIWVRDSVGDLTPIAKLSDHEKKVSKFEEFAETSADGRDPICRLDKSQISDLVSQREWYRDLVINTTAFGGVYVRYRFIDVAKSPNKNELAKKEIIRQLYRFLEKFVYFDGSCTDVVKQSFHFWDGETLLKIFEDSHRFPEDWVNIYDRSSSLQFNAARIEKIHSLSSTMNELSNELRKFTLSQPTEILTAYSNMLKAGRENQMTEDMDATKIQQKQEIKKTTQDEFMSLQANQNQKLSEIQAQMEVAAEVRKRLMTSPSEMSLEGKHEYFLNAIAFAYCTNFVNFDPNHLQFLADYFHLAFQKEGLFEKEKDVSEFDSYFNHSPALPDDSNSNEDDFKSQPRFLAAMQQMEINDHPSFKYIVDKVNEFDDKKIQATLYAMAKQKEPDNPIKARALKKKQRIDSRHDINSTEIGPTLFDAKADGRYEREKIQKEVKLF